MSYPQTKYVLKIIFNVFQVLHIIDSVLEPLVPTSVREAEYFVQLDAKKLLTKSTLYDLGGERLKVFYDQAELSGRYMHLKLYLSIGHALW